MRYATPQPSEPVLPYFASWCDLLFPPGYDRRKRTLAMLGNRVGWSAVRNWRAGRRRVPAWAIAELERTLAKAKEKARD